MNINIPYGTSGLSFTLPDKNIWQILFPVSEKLPGDLKNEILKSLMNPIGSPPLSEIIRQKGNPIDLKAVILCDIMTNPTIQKDILDVLIPHLQEIGILLSNVRIIVSTGVYRPMKRNEICKTFGKWMAPVLIENHMVNENLVSVGSLPLIGDIFLNQTAKEADIKIGIEMLSPHPISGFSGGAKIILPGIAGTETIDKYNKLFALSIKDSYNRIDNKMRTLSNQAASLFGLDFIINAVLNATDVVSGVFSGNFCEAFKKGADFATKVMGIRIKLGADLVIAGSYPADQDLWQAFEAFLNISPIARKGGMIIFITPSFEGVSSVHPYFKEYIGTPTEKLLEGLKNNELRDPSAAAFAAQITREFDRIEFCLYSDGVSVEESSIMKIKKFTDIKDAVGYCQKKLGEDMKVSIVPYGGKIFPYFETEETRKDKFKTAWL